jgi:hypothetical protein
LVVRRSRSESIDRCFADEGVHPGFKIKGEEFACGLCARGIHLAFLDRIFASRTHAAPFRWGTSAA